MNPAQRVMAALGRPLAGKRERVGPSVRGVAKRKRLRKIARASRRFNLR